MFVFLEFTASFMIFEFISIIMQEETQLDYKICYYLIYPFAYIVYPFLHYILPLIRIVLIGIKQELKTVGVKVGIILLFFIAQVLLKYIFGYNQW